MASHKPNKVAVQELLEKARMTVLNSINKDHKIRISTLCPSTRSPQICLEHPHGRIRVRLRVHGTSPLLLLPEPFSPYSTRAAICWTHIQAMSHRLLFKSGRSAVRCRFLAIESLCLFLFSQLQAHAQRACPSPLP